MKYATAELTAPALMMSCCASLLSLPCAPCCYCCGTPAAAAAAGWGARCL